jgi:pyridoxamine 5'-phosphate oxidase
MSISDPIKLFDEWYADARQAGIGKPHAMALATLSEEGEEIAHMSSVALVFWWDPLGYQVRIEGKAEKTTEVESDAYFAGRPRGSQLSAWASDQSRVIEGRSVLEKRMRAFEQKYVEREVPRPPHWGGYRVIPGAIEFWENRDDRLHHRVRFERMPDGGWRAAHLAP